MYLTQSEESLIKKSCSKNVEKCRKQVGPARGRGDENRPLRAETENVSGRRGFIYIYIYILERPQSDT